MGAWVGNGDSPNGFFMLATSEDGGKSWSKPRVHDIGWHDAWVHIEGTQLPNGVEQDIRLPPQDFCRLSFGSISSRHAIPYL